MKTNPRIILGAAITMVVVSSCAVTLETIAVPAEQSSWQLAYGINRQRATMKEFVAPGETLSNWSRMLTIQFLEGERASPRQVVERARKNMQAECPGAELTVISEDALSVTYEWWTGTCTRETSQHEVARLIRGNDGVHRVAYVRKVPRLETQEREKWLQILSEAYVIKGERRVEVAR